MSGANFGRQSSIMNNCGARKKMSNMNGDNLFMLRDLKRTEIGPTMTHRNKVYNDTCARQVGLWKKEAEKKVNDVRKSQRIFRSNLHRMQADKGRTQYKGIFVPNQFEYVRTQAEKNVCAKRDDLTKIMKTILKDKTEKQILQSVK